MAIRAIFLLTLGLVASLLLASCGPVQNRERGFDQGGSVGTSTSTPDTRAAAISDICRRYGGQYSRIYRECDATAICQAVGINQMRACGNSFQNECRNVGGQFNACVSPCRRQPNVRACISACVPVCRG